MPNIHRFLYCLILVLASISISACGSSDSQTTENVENRPTIVSSDAVTIRDNTDNASTDEDSASGVDAEVDQGSEEDTAPVHSDEPSDTSVDASQEATGINTIEALLAHLEAQRNNSATVSPDDADSTETDGFSSEPVTNDPVDSVPEDSVGTGDTGDITPVTDDSGELVDTVGNEPVSDDQLPTSEAEASTDVAPVEDENSPVVDSSDGTDAQEPVTAESGEGEIEGELLNDDTTADTDAGTPAVDPGFSSDKHDIVVDCEFKLPCEVKNTDGAVAVVIENVYRNPQTQRLAIAMGVTANRDTALKWDNDVTSTDDVATTYNGTSRDFSGFYQFDRDNDMVTLLAGTTLIVVQHFREMPSDTTVSMVRFDTGYIEAGVRTTLQFSNMPLDPILGEVVDCADQVPCSWVANDQSYSVNVLKVSGLWQTGRLRIDFEVRATVGLGLNLFSPQPVVGNDGAVFTPRTHSLGGTSDYQEFTARLVPEGVQTGHQDFLKNANRLATSLKQVKLGMTRIDAPGAGSPVFRNLPLE